MINYLLQYMQIRSRRGQKGQTLIEYALIIALIAFVIFSVFSLLTGEVVLMFKATFGRMEDSTS